MRIVKAIIIAAAATAICSCSAYKHYTGPETDNLDKLYGLECTDSNSIAQISWQDFFTDPILQDLIRQGLENNRNLRIACQRINEAEANLTVARLSFIPGLSLSPSVSLSGKKGESNVNISNLGMSASWEADIRGSLYNQKRKAQAAYEQSQVYKLSVETELIASIARAYYSLQMLDSKMSISQQTASSWKENVRIMKAMKEAGMVNEASVAQTEANSCSIEASLFDLEYQIRQMENTLCLLIGSEPKQIERSPFNKSAIKIDPLLGVPAQLLSRRPDVMSAELEYKKAFFGTAAAEANLYPSINIGGSVGWAPSDLLYTLAASLAEPIFNSGRNRANLKIARAQQEEALASFEQALLTAGAEVNDAIVKCRTAQSKTDIRIQQIEDLRSAVNSTTQLMHNSSATYLEVLTAQQSLLSARLLQVSDQFDAIDGMISLYKALGGGAE